MELKDEIEVLNCFAKLMEIKCEYCNYFSYRKYGRCSRKVVEVSKEEFCSKFSRNTNIAIEKLDSLEVVIPEDYKMD